MRNQLVFIVGTSRSDGNTWHLLNYINKDLGAKLIDLTELNISYFDYQQRNIDDDYIATIEEILKYDTIAFVSPMYWYTVSAQMKTFIDRFSDLLGSRKDLGRKLRGKKTFLVATGNTEERVNAGMEEPIKLTSEYLGMNYQGAFYTRVKNDLQIEPHILEQASNFVRSILQG